MKEGIRSILIGMAIGVFVVNLPSPYPFIVLGLAIIGLLNELFSSSKPPTQ